EAALTATVATAALAAVALIAAGLLRGRSGAGWCVVWSSYHVRGSLELEAAFTRCIGEGFDFSVIEVTAAVENDGADVRAFGALRDQSADLLRALDVRGGVFDRLVEGGGGEQGLAGRVVDDLGVNVLVR